MRYRTKQLNLRLSTDEVTELKRAAAECGMSVGEWLRTIATYAAGLPLAEHIDSAATAGRQLVHAAIAKQLGAKPGRGKVRSPVEDTNADDR